MDIPEVIIVAAIAAFFGAMVGYSQNNSDWRNDCEQLGKHRVNTTAYVCKKETP